MLYHIDVYIFFATKNILFFVYYFYAIFVTFSARISRLDFALQSFCYSRLESQVLQPDGGRPRSLAIA